MKSLGFIENYHAEINPWRDSLQFRSIKDIIIWKNERKTTEVNIIKIRQMHSLIN